MTIIWVVDYHERCYCGHSYTNPSMHKCFQLSWWTGSEGAEICMEMTLLSSSGGMLSFSVLTNSVYMSCHCSVLLPTVKITVLKVLLMTSDVGYPFMCLLAILISFILTKYCTSYFLLLTKYLTKAPEGRERFFWLIVFRPWDRRGKNKGIRG